MNGRLYDPAVGRFLNADPVIQNPGNSQNYNRYSYCLNNPLKYADLSGYKLLEFNTAKDVDMLRASGGGSGYMGNRDNNHWVNDYMQAKAEGYNRDVYDFLYEYDNQVSSPNFNGSLKFTYYTTSSRNCDEPGCLPSVSIIKTRHDIIVNLTGGDVYQGAGMINNLSFLGDGVATITTNFLVNEYKRGADVVEVIKGVKTVSNIGKLSNALNISAIIYDIGTGNIHSSTLADAAMFGTGLIIGVAVGPITAGVVGLVYGGTMLMGGQDAINNSFDGNWNIDLNKKIKAIYRR